MKIERGCLSSMAKIYKGIRFKREGMYLIETVSFNLEQQLKEKYSSFNNDIEGFVDEYKGYSITVIMKVSSSSVVELAISKFNSNLNENEINKLKSDFDIFQRKLDPNIKVGNLAQRLYIEEENDEIVKKLGYKFKGDKIKSLKWSEVISLIMFSYCKDNNLI